MGPGHRYLSLPASATQCIQRPVVAGAREGVALDRVTVLERVLGQGGPGQRRRRVRRSDRPRILALGELDSRRVDGQTGLGDTQQVAHQGWVPALRRFSQACTTRAAMCSSATLPQARGSYFFLLPTSLSIFRTPS